MFTLEAFHYCGTAFRSSNRRSIRRTGNSRLMGAVRQVSKSVVGEIRTLRSAGAVARLHQLHHDVAPRMHCQAMVKQRLLAVPAAETQRNEVDVEIGLEPEDSRLVSGRLSYPRHDADDLNGRSTLQHPTWPTPFHAPDRGQLDAGPSLNFVMS